MKTEELTYRESMPSTLRLLAEDVNNVLAPEIPNENDVSQAILCVKILRSELQEAMRKAKSNP